MDERGADGVPDELAHDVSDDVGSFDFADDVDSFDLAYGIADDVADDISDDVSHSADRISDDVADDFANRVALRLPDDVADGLSNEISNASDDVDAVRLPDEISNHHLDGISIPDASLDDVAHSESSKTDSRMGHVVVPSDDGGSFRRYFWSHGRGFRRSRQRNVVFPRVRERDRFEQIGGLVRHQRILRKRYHGSFRDGVSSNARLR